MKFMRKFFVFFLTAVILSSVIFSSYAAMPDWADEFVNEFGPKLTEDEKYAVYSRLWFSYATLDDKMPILEIDIPNINYNYIQYGYENRKDIESTTFELFNYNWEENTVNFEYMITNSYNDLGHEGIYIMIIERGTDRVWRVERIDKYGSSSDLYKKVNDTGVEKLVAADWTEVRPDDPYITPPSEAFTRPYVVARYHRASIEVPYYFDSEYYGVYIVPVYHRDTYSGGSYFGYYFEDAIELTRTSPDPIPDPIPDPTPGCSIKYYRDSKKMFEVTDLATVNPQLCTYYDIVCDDGYVCRSLEVTADYADNEKIIFGNTTVSAQVPEYGLLGDVDGNGVINTNDVTMLLRYISGWTIVNEYNGRVADYNGDGIVNISDCSAILKSIAKWDNVEIGDGIAEDFQVYCNIGAVTNVITQDGVSENPYNGIGYLTVIKNTAELHAYIDKVSGKYKMTEDGSAYSAASLIEKYSEDFFNAGNIVIVDAEAPLFVSESSQIKVELTSDSKIRIIFPLGTNPTGTKDAAAHCITEIPKSFELSYDNILLITRASEDTSFNKLFNYIENDAFSEIRKH